MEVADTAGIIPAVSFFRFDVQKAHAARGTCVVGTTQGRRGERREAGRSSDYKPHIQ